MKLVLNFSLSLFAVILVSGCAGTADLPNAVSARQQVVHFPDVGVEAEAEIGQTLISKANLSVVPAIVLDGDKSEEMKQAMMNNRHSGVIKVPAGKLLKYAENADGSFYESKVGIYQAYLPFPYPVGVFVPHDKRSPAVLFVFHTVIGGKGYEFGKIPVAYADSKSESWSKDSFKKELIYGGLSQKSISISYREFSDGTARPAFSQELKYDLNDGDVIGFRGARFQVLKATNTTIKYKMLKALD